VEHQVILRYKYLAAENRILKAQLKTQLPFADAERMTLAEIAHRLGRKALEDVANLVKPDTLLGSYRRLIAVKFDGFKWRVLTLGHHPLKWLIILRSIEEPW
jgi:hypothetical protein